MVADLAIHRRPQSGSFVVDVGGRFGVAKGLFFRRNALLTLGISQFSSGWISQRANSWLGVIYFYAFPARWFVLQERAQYASWHQRMANKKNFSIRECTQ